MSINKSLDPRTYIFIDESGKPEIYSSKGENLVEKAVASKYLILSAVRCNDQLKLQQNITAFKLQLLQDKSLTKIFSTAYTLDSFHAQIDYPQVQELFYKHIATLDIKVNIIVVEKLKCFETLKQNPGKLYGVMAGQMLKDLCHQSTNTEIIFSRKDSKLKLRQELETEVERVRLEYMTKHPNLTTNINLSYQHNPHYTHSGLQVADYIAYAIYQHYERGNSKWMRLINHKIGKLHDICNRKIFTRSNPLELSS